MLNFLHKLIMTLGILCVSIGLTAQIIPPPTITRYFPTYDNDGAMDFYVQYPSANQRDPFTSISNIKKPSSNGKINFVIPINGSITFIPTFVDLDYYQSIDRLTGNPVTDQNGNVIPPRVITNDRNYERTLQGHPIPKQPFVGKYNQMGSPALIETFTNLPSDKHTLTYTIEDKGPNYTGTYVEGSILDTENVSLSVDVYLMDLVEQTRTIKLQQSQIFPINLDYTPADFPHENICYIVASWGLGFPMPGMPAPASNLYTDPECTNAITGDTSTSSEKSWQIGGNIPSTIYYKKPATGTGSIKLILRMKDGSTSSDMVTKTLTFANADMLLKSVDAQGGIGGWWTGALSTYPTPEWLDYNEDGNVIDPIGSSNNDNNRPFIFSKADQELFSIDKVIFKKKNSSYNLTGKTLSATSNLYGINASGIAFPTPTGDTYEITSNSLEGDIVTNIAADNVTITWSIADNNTFTSTHKVYVIGGEMSSLSGRNYHTLIDIGCTAAAGKNTEEEIFYAIWNKFKTLSIKRIDGGADINYWGANPYLVNNVEDMLTYRNARCGVWADFFQKTLKIQGVDIGVRAFSIDGCEWNGNMGHFLKTNPEDGLEYMVSMQQTSNDFQGTGNPNGAGFVDHAINAFYEKNPLDNMNYLKFFDVTSGESSDSFTSETFDYYIENYIKIKYTNPTTGTSFTRDLTVNDIVIDQYY